MTQAVHPYRKQLLAHHAPGSYSASTQHSMALDPYPTSGSTLDPSTGSANSNAYQSAYSDMTGNSNSTYKGSGPAESLEPVSPQRHAWDQSEQMIQPRALAARSAPGSKAGSVDSLPMPIVLGGSGARPSHQIHTKSLHGSHHGSDPSLPPDTPLGARSFTLPQQTYEDLNRSFEASRSESPASLGTDLQTNNSGKSHVRQSKSVDLSHMYLLDRDETAHFTLTNESLSDVSQNLIRQYLGENSTSSLLPRMKTIEMYRKNVKKSNDPKVLFQYAQYMLQTALTMDQNSANDGPSEPESDTSLEKSMKKQFLKEAIHYLKKLSDKGYTDAQYLLADGYSSGALGKVDNKEAFTLFQSAAKHGHVESAYRTAYCYEEGLGVGRDSRRSIEFLKYAASKNHPAAMYKLGVYSFYSRMGLPDNRNVKKSGIQWLTRAVTKANELTNAAPYELGKIYDEGFLDIIIPDHKYSMELYVQAASLGHTKSAAILGKAYEMGDDVVPQDADLSIHYYTQAAVAGDPESMLALCAWYMLGNPPNLEKDNFEAFQWAIRAAKLGFPKAQSTVGHFFEKGIGCDTDVDSAKYWYTLATKSGDERAKTKLKKFDSISSSAATSPPLPAALGASSADGTRLSTASLTLDSSIVPTPPYMKEETKKEKAKREKKEKKENKEKKDKDCVIM